MVFGGDSREQTASGRWPPSAGAWPHGHHESPPRSIRPVPSGGFGAVPPPVLPGGPQKVIANLGRQPWAWIVCLGEVWKYLRCVNGLVLGLRQTLAHKNRYIDRAIHIREGV